MKRIVAIWVACALLFCCVCAGAEDQAVTDQREGSGGWRLSNDMSVDPFLFQTLLKRLCPSRLLRHRAEKVGALLNAIEPSLTVAGDGIQLDVDLNGENALSIGGTLTDEGVAVASTLFPSYVISVSTGKLMEIVSDIKPMVAPPKSDAKDTPAEAAPPETASPEAVSDDGEAAPSGTQETDSGEFLPVEQMSQYVSIADSESGEYQENGVSFDVRRVYSVDCDGLVGLWNTFVNWVFGNKGIAYLLDIANKADLEISAEQVKALLPSGDLPRFDATFYSSSTTADRFITATAASEDGSKVFGDARLQITEDDVTADIHVPPLTLDIDFEMHRAEGLQAKLDVRGKDALLNATFSADDETMHGQIDLPAMRSDARLVLTRQDEGSKGRLEINADGNYLGSDFEFMPFDASGDGLRFTASLYYTDDTNPLFREELLFQPYADLTLDFTDANKTVVPITSLVNVGNGYLVGFAMDIAFNGIGGLLDAATKILAEMNRSTKEPAAAPAA